MRILTLVLCVLTLHVQSPAMESQSCEELSKETRETFRKMDDAIRLKSGMLLGEMEGAKEALKGCISQNQMESIRLSLLWFFGDVGVTLTFIFLFLHGRRTRLAFRGLSHLLHSYSENHPVTYEPAKTYFRFALSLLVLTFIIINFAGLFL